MQIEERAIDSIAPYEKNPRDHGAAIDGIAESIRRFGFKQPLVIDANGTIVCGHARYFAARKLGLATVPCVLANELTENEVRAYRLLDNKLRDLSTWNLDALQAELASFEFDFAPFGVDFQPGASVEPNFDAFEPTSNEVEPNAKEPDGANLDEDDARVSRSYKIVVSCDDEEEQRELYERLTEEGYEARLCNL